MFLKNPTNSCYSQVEEKDGKREERTPKTEEKKPGKPDKKPETESKEPKEEKYVSRFLFNKTRIIN